MARRTVSCYDQSGSGNEANILFFKMKTKTIANETLKRALSWAVAVKRMCLPSTAIPVFPTLKYPGKRRGEFSLCILVIFFSMVSPVVQENASTEQLDTINYSKAGGGWVWNSGSGSRVKKEPNKNPSVDCCFCLGKKCVFISRGFAFFLLLLVV